MGQLSLPSGNVTGDIGLKTVVYRFSPHPVVGKGDVHDT